MMRSIYIIRDMVSRGAKIQAYDPKVINEAKELYLKNISNITYHTAKYEMLKVPME